MQDKNILCAVPDCGTEFVFSANDQEFYASKNFTPPKYCRYHRDLRKQERAKREAQKNSPFAPALEEMRRRNENRHA